MDMGGKGGGQDTRTFVGRPPARPLVQRAARDRHDGRHRVGGEVQVAAAIAAEEARQWRARVCGRVLEAPGGAGEEGELLCFFSHVIPQITHTPKSTGGEGIKP